MKLYIISEVSFEYNDEISYAIEGGTPIFATFDEEEAQAKLENYQVEFLLGCDITEYCYQLEEIGLDSVYLNAAGIKCDEGTYPITIPLDHPRSQVRKIAQEMTFSSHFITELDVTVNFDGYAANIKTEFCKDTKSYV